MLRQILVAMDSSAIGKNVFDQALVLAKATDASLILLHVLSTEEKGSPNALRLSNLGAYPGINHKVLELYQEDWKAFEKQGLELLRLRTEQANVAGVKTEFIQKLGNPGRNICEVAHTCGVELIVIGRRGRSGVGELILGSVSNYVLHHAPCSVFVVQGQVKPSYGPSLQEQEHM